MRQHLNYAREEIVRDFCAMLCSVLYIFWYVNILALIIILRYHLQSIEFNNDIMAHKGVMKKKKDKCLNFYISYGISTLCKNIRRLEQKTNKKITFLV